MADISPVIRTSTSSLPLPQNEQKSLYLEGIPLFFIWIGKDFVNHPILFSLQSSHPVISVGIFLYLLIWFTCMVRDYLIKLFFESHYLFCSYLYIACLTLCTTHRLVNHNS